MRSNVPKLTATIDMPVRGVDTATVSASVLRTNKTATRFTKWHRSLWRTTLQEPLGAQIGGTAVAGTAQLMPPPQMPPAPSPTRTPTPTPGPTPSMPPFRAALPRCPPPALARPASLATTCSRAHLTPDPDPKTVIAMLPSTSPREVGIFGDYLPPCAPNPSPCCCACWKPCHFIVSHQHDKHLLSLVHACSRVHATPYVRPQPCHRTSLLLYKHGWHA